MLHTICHQRKFEIRQFWEMQPVKYREYIGHVVVATQCYLRGEVMNGNETKCAHGGL